MGRTLRRQRRFGLPPLTLENRKLTSETEKLPLWRLIAGILVLLGMAGILLALAPVYFEDYQLGRYIRSLPSRSWRRGAG